MRYGIESARPQELAGPFSYIRRAASKGLPFVSTITSGIWLIMTAYCSFEGRTLKKLLRQLNHSKRRAVGVMLRDDADVEFGTTKHLGDS